MSDKKIYLVSPGGSGCNLMYHLFGEATMKAGWTWPNVHQRFAQLPEPENAKVLYLMADPAMILLSLSRRFWHLENWPDMINALGADLNGMHNVKDPKTDRPTLERYADYGQNLFNFQGHLNAWIGYCSLKKIPSRFIAYENIPKEIGDIADFIGMPVKNPFEWRVREAGKNIRNKAILIDRLRTIHRNDERWWEYLLCESWKIQ